MAKITVFTKQNYAVLEQLGTDGRYIAKEKYMRKEMEDTSDIMFLVYGWLSAHMPNQNIRPSDARFPVWVSLAHESTMLPEPGYVVLEIEVDEELLAYADITKWTRIINYSFIPKDDADNEAHNKLLSDYGISDVKALMTPFYPQIKRKVMNSWSRLFDDNVILPGSGAGKYGLLWEVRKEWIRGMTVSGERDYARIPEGLRGLNVNGGPWRSEAPKNQGYVTLYSPQAPAVWEAVRRYGTAYSKREYVQKKYQESAAIFTSAYDFFVREAQNYAVRPDGAEYPYWAFLSSQDLDPSGGGEVMILKVPLDEAVFFDMFDWYKILKLSYMGEDEDEEKRFHESLEAQGIKDPSKIFLSPFYPLQKQQIVQSWKRLFRWDAAIKSAIKSSGQSSADVTETDRPLGEDLPQAVEAGLWCIKKEWVQNL